MTRWDEAHAQEWCDKWEITSNAQNYSILPFRNSVPLICQTKDCSTEETELWCVTSHNELISLGLTHHGSFGSLTRSSL